MKWKFLILNVLLFSSTIQADARFPRGEGIVPAATTCDITTGNCTGLDTGTGLFTAATCNGVADDRTAFNSFNTWAQASSTNTNGLLLELYVPSGKLCRWTTGNVNVNLVMTGIRNGRISAYGATFQNPTGNGFRLGPASQPGGICQKGLTDPAGCSARINTVLAGATSVTITNTSYCSRFVTGRWLAVTGFDLQGGYQSVFGEPPNPHFLEFVQIGSTVSCAATGVIQLVTPLVNSYLSTWPEFSAGGATGSDKGGPATIYALVSDWGGSVDIRGLTIDSSGNQTIVHGKSVTLRDVTMTGSDCVIPSQNDTFTMINSTGTNCTIEVDKIINTITYSNTTLRRVSFQSSSTNTLNWDGGSLSLDLNGTPKVANISNLTTPTIRLGPYAYGTPISATCTNCVITDQISAFGVQEKGGPGDPGANIFYTVSGGVFSYPLVVNVTNLTSNGSGKVRLTVGDTTGWKTGTRVTRNSLFSACSAPSPCSNPAVLLTVVDGTTIDLPDYNFADVTWSGAGSLSNSAEQERWAIPGTNVTALGGTGPSLPFFQVNSVAISGNFVSIATTLPGGYPTVPLSSGKSNLQVTAPSWTCTNCSGNAQALDFSGAPPNIPFASYSKRSYTNSTALVNSPLWGKVTTIKINVTQAYTGSTNPMRFNPSAVTVIPAGTTSNWNVNINLRQAGLRTITPAGVTCDTGGGPVVGGCTGDGTLTLPDPNTFFSGNLNLAKPDGSPTDQPWAMDYEFIMNQDVVP